MDKIKLKNIIEAVLLASDRILSLSQIEKILTEKQIVSNKQITEEMLEKTEAMAANDSTNADEVVAEADPVSEEQTETTVEETPESISLKNSVKEIIDNLQQDYSGRAMELKEVASGYRFQVRQEYADNVSKLWEERPSKYSRALLETLVLIAYRQPITRGEIEAIRGVSVSSHIIKTLVEREWVRVIGHRDVPGRPSIYGSTKEFLDYFNLKSLDELPSLAELKDLDKIAPELALNEKAEELTAALKEAGTELLADDSAAGQPTASSPESSPKAQVRRMRRVRRLGLRHDESEKNDQTDSDNVTTSQENEPDEVELS